MERFLIANGGNSKHLPGHTLEACLSAYTAGADGLSLTVQLSLDKELICYEYDDLSEQTDGSGRISQHTKKEIASFDAGVFFSRGKDTPWKKSDKYNRLITLGALEDLLTVLEDNVTYFLKPGMPSDSIHEKLIILEQIQQLFFRKTVIKPVIVVDDPKFYNMLIRMPEYETFKIFCDFPIADDFTTDRTIFMLVRDETKKVRYDELAKTNDIRVVLNDNNSYNQEKSAFILTDSVTQHIKNSGTLRTFFSEKWEGNAIDTRHWVGGNSSGHHAIRPMIGIEEYNEPVFCASVNVNDGLHVNVVEGVTYASAGVVSKFSLDEHFEAEVDFVFDNPQVANMMVFSVINQEVWESYYHHMGIQENPSVYRLNHAFDSHGAAPFVSMEREEADGFRIMKYTSNAGVYEWYGNFYLCDVGNGNSTKGKLKLERRGRFFSGYYMDENNEQWIGVGSTVNNSMNKRIFLRLAAKHYPKNNAPNPLKSLNVTYSNLLISIPKAPLYQPAVSRNPLDL